MSTPGDTPDGQFLPPLELFALLQRLPALAMPKLETLLHQSKAELDALARASDLDGYSTLDKAGLLIALAEEPLGEDAKAIIRSSKAKLDERAREAGLGGLLHDE